MKVIIAGSRTITDYNELIRALTHAGIQPSHIVSGGARGVDQLGEKYASLHNIPVIQYLPDWDTYGKRAGYVRNMDMANSGAEMLICLWDGCSKGTKNMIDIAKQRGLKVHVEMVDITKMRNV